MMRIFNFLAGALLGGIVGASLAILLTPKSGEDLRSQFQDRTIRLKDEIKSVAEARRAELERELAGLRAPYRK